MLFRSEYEVEPTNVSTPESEYAPFFHKKTGTFWFVREQKFYDFVNFQSDRSSGPPAMAIWSAEYKNQRFHAIKNPASLINPEKHMGPLVFSDDGSMACYSETSRFAELNRPVSTQLLLARKPNSVSTAYFQKHVFQYARPLPFSSDSFFTSHPAFSPDGKELIFSSNRNGSVGGKDLWSVRIDTSGSNIQFSNLRPLGPDINTSEDELAPVFKSSNELLFASNGHPGFGGLDLFSARRINDQWVFYGNEGLKLNSGGDDFGICFTSDSTGFFASNRINGKGKDDIYKFVFKKRLTEVKGILWFSKNKEKPVVNTWVYLKDENGKLIDSVKTNRKGFFVFRQLPVGTKYMISFSEDTSVVFSNYVLSDENGIISDRSEEHTSELQSH